MADNTDIIKEFLVSLGFQVDQSGLKKFTGGLDATTKTAITAGKAVLGVAVAAEAAVTVFTASMEKLYFASQRTGASVANIQGLEQGFRQVGLSSGVATESLERMAAVIRMNPGIKALADGFLGKDSGAMDQTEAMLQLVEKMAAMPHYVGAQWAQQFGMDEKTFLMVKQGLPEIREAQRHMAEMRAKLGVDPDQAARDAHEYQKVWRDITAKMDIVAQKWMTQVLPYAKTFAGYIDHSLDRLADVKLDKKLEDLIGFLKKYTTAPMQAASELQKGNVGGAVGAMIENAPGTVAARSAWQWLKDNVHIRKVDPDAHRTGGGKIKYPSPTAAKPGDLFSSLETMYGLPAGLLDRVWAKESGRGKYMLSPKGARGHFGFMPDTAKEYGLDDPDDLGKSASAAARKWRDLLNRYNGDLSMAAAAYNWGDGRLAKFGMKNAPFETRDYVASITGAIAGKGDGRQVTINQKTDIHVAGGDSPVATGRAVALVQDEVTGNMVRNMRGAIQ